MANTTMSGAISNAAKNMPAPAAGSAPAARAPKGPTAILQDLLNSKACKSRIEDVLGKRAPQFTSSLIQLVNSDVNLQNCAIESPMSIISAGLKAAIMDLPVDAQLGFAYVIPFKRSIKQPDGSFVKRWEAQFILGYKGLLQLAMRTGAYANINVTDVREGELIKYDRLTEEIEINWVEDEEERDALPIIGWVGYFKLANGASKTIYMSRKAIDAHERRHRKGQYMSPLWKTDYEAMAVKTVYRRLLGKYGLLSIEYRTYADPENVRLAAELANPLAADDDGVVIDLPPDQVTELPPVEG